MTTQPIFAHFTNEDHNLDVRAFSSFDQIKAFMKIHTYLKLVRIVGGSDEERKKFRQECIPVYILKKTSTHQRMIDAFQDRIHEAEKNIEMCRSNDYEMQIEQLIRMVNSLCCMLNHYVIKEDEHKEEFSHYEFKS